MKLAELYSYEKYKTDKGTAHSYIDSYDELLAQYQNKQINFLEIGCLAGESLRMFNDYFENAEIYGIDNWSYSTNFDGTNVDLADLCEKFKTKYPEIQLITCNSTDPYDVSLKIKNTFDVIIDDGDHTLDGQFATFANFIPKLNAGGIYIIEDVAKYNIPTLISKIQNHIMKYSLNWLENIEVRELYKNGRWDDVLFAIKYKREG
jgi:cephalosporin hydroxylase